MTDDDFAEKTAIVTGDTIGSQFQKADSAPPSLVVLIGPTALIGRQFFLTKREYLIGRSSDCEIHIDDRSVSRNHAKILFDGKGVILTDLNSANKTLVKETQLQPNLPFRLENNDQIKCGNVIFKFYEKGNLQAYANQALMEKALKDTLTGAYTKGALLERGPEVIKRSQSQAEDLTILVFDIDHFKKINDTHGHPGGDYVLKELGRLIINSVIRSEDFFARYGGEEFVLVLLKSNQKVGLEVAERLRSTVQNHIFNYHGAIVPVTISVGVAQRDSQDKQWDDLFSRADKALYQSKQSGRNRVTMAS
jgi:two-component system, cell cycle response regulator